MTLRISTQKCDKCGLVVKEIVRIEGKILRETEFECDCYE